MDRRRDWNHWGGAPTRTQTIAGRMLERGGLTSREAEFCASMSFIDHPSPKQARVLLGIMARAKIRDGRARAMAEKMAKERAPVQVPDDQQPTAAPTA